MSAHHSRVAAVAGVVASALAWATLSTPLRAVDLRGVLTGYAIASWDVNDGAPEGAVYALAQDADGYLWLGTHTGLHRFDGSRFRSWSSLSPQALPGEVVLALYVARDNSLWAGFASGGVSRIRGADVRTFSQADGLPRSAVNIIFEDRTGVLWAGTDAGLFFSSEGSWRRLDVTSGLPDGAVWGAHVDARGEVLLVGSAGLFRRRAGASRFEALESFRGSAGNRGTRGRRPDEQLETRRLISDNRVRTITIDKAGRVFVSDLRSGFRSLAATAAARWQHPGRGLALMFDTRDNLWVATGGQGVWRVSGLTANGQPMVERVSAATGLATEGAFSLLEDRHGNIWAGGSPSGLTRLTPQRFIPVPQGSSVMALTMSPQGRVWVGTSDALIEIAAPDRHPLVERSRLVGDAIRALHVDRQGSLWVGTDRQLLRLLPGRDRFDPVDESHPLRQVDSIADYPGGGALIADAENGLLRWTERDGLRPLALPRQLTGMRFVTAYADNRQRIWLASAEGHIARLDDGGGATLFTPEQGFTAGAGRIIHQDQRGVIWFGGTNGVTRYEDERAVTIRGDERLPIRQVRAITDDRDGYLWMATTRGLLRIHHTEVAQAAAHASYRPTYAFFDQSDGLAGLPRIRSDSTALRTLAGSLWFTTGEGITIVPPDAQNEDVTAPRVSIDGVTVDDQNVDAVQGIKLPAGVHRLQIDYAALNLTSAHKTRFRFRLEGADADWVDAGVKRQASYTNLPSGSYRFRVAATDLLGRWTEPTQAWAFSIQPHFYETPGFLASCILLVLLAAWAAWTLRLRHERKRFSLVLAERARLSREIHDTLLQGLVGLVLQCDAIANDLQSASPAMTDKLIRLRQQGQRYIKDARHAIWHLRSAPNTVGLVEALRDFGTQAAGTAAGFSVVTQGTPQSLGDDVELELLRIAREAVTNAVLHAGARQIDLTISYSARSVVLTVSDNGCGFADGGGLGQDGHYGIVNMRERAALIGADLRLTSRPGAGTRVEIIVPRRSAVAKVAV